ncbi:EAL domain-containing protein [Alteromonadaceae bacterium M269]|nr:EAL domain-containing protein [Alteromonadaceae bacterium M269]
MKPFVSLPFKLLALLIVMLLITGILITRIWLVKIDDDFEWQQLQKRQLAIQQYSLLHQIVRNRIETSLESYVQLKADDSNHLQSIIKGLNNEFEFLQLQWNMSELWLLNEDFLPLFESTDASDEAIQTIEKTIELQAPVSKIVCNPACNLLLSLPVLTNDGEVAYLAVSHSMLEILAFLNQSTGADLAIVSPNKERLSGRERVTELVVLPPISPTLRMKMESVIAAAESELMVGNLLTSGANIEMQDKSYLVNLVPLNGNHNANNFIFLVEDISSFVANYKRIQTIALIVALSLFFVLSALMLVVTFRVRVRMLKLANNLPLLAEHDYKTFRENKPKLSRWLEDELDYLNRSADKLSDELELLDKEIEQRTRELENIAMYDLITGLPNRNMLDFQLRKALFSIDSEPGQVGLLFLDLDDFKKVNDSQGHSIGDSLLLEVSKRLKKAIRSTDIACRFGGDEFVVMVPQCDGVEELKLLGEQILIGLRDPIQISESRFYMSTSIGIAMTRDSDCSTEDLIRQADVAMYDAKDKGGSCYRVFDDDMFERVAKKVMLESEVREALRDEHFFFALQPQIDINNNKLIGFEALLRWKHPTRGMIAPDDFIPVLENSEHMIVLGYWGLKRSFEILQNIALSGFGRQKIAVNMSASQFLDPELVPFLMDLFSQYTVSPSQLELELTERSLVVDFEKTLSVMMQIRELGVSFSIDDFGTGYSSLSYLKKMPVDIIKIDRSFVSGMMDNKADMQIVESTIGMVRSLGMQVIAEGVETRAQLYQLHGYDCDMAQGYLFSKPISEDEIMQALGKYWKHGVWESAKQLQQAANQA